MKNIKILKGHFVYTKDKDEFQVHENSYLVVNDKKVVGLYKELPKVYRGLSIKDYGNALIIPSFIDLHIHAPQYVQMGMGLDLQLIDWLNQYTFKNEAFFADVAYAKKVYPYFVEELYKEGTLRCCIFATLHLESTYVLVNELKKKRLSAYVGKVNMNRHAPDNLIQTTEASIQETKDFIHDHGEDALIKPIITPRFAPSCTSELLGRLGRLSCDKKIPVQTHLSETKREVEWVKELFPQCKHYSDVYKNHNLYGCVKTILAHAIYLSQDELEMAKDDNIYLVHCPNSNMNLTSGIMPLTYYLDRGIKVGLGSDVGAGHKIGMQHTITSAIQCSKIRHTRNEEDRILTLSEAFYIATKLNGSFFGLVGSFEEGYAFDALVIKDDHPLFKNLPPLEKLQRFLYTGDSDSIVERYLEGEVI